MDTTDRQDLWFHDIRSPGAYVEHRTGALLRLPQESVRPGKSPVIQVETKEPWMVTQISQDPNLPLDKARNLADKLDVPANF